MGWGGRRGLEGFGERLEGNEVWGLVEVDWRGGDGKRSEKWEMGE